MELVAFDLETTGGYPIKDEICEFGAVKWADGKIIDRFETLVRPNQIMTDFIIGIHGITNEMVADAPPIQKVIQPIRDFIGNAYPVAHHAPFDLGFLTIEFEKHGIPLPLKTALCTSLLARKIFPESTNHKLQTLIKFLNIEAGTAHRASSDAEACLNVFLKCHEKMDHCSFEKLKEIQNKSLHWDRFSIKQLANSDELVHDLLEFIGKKEPMEVMYAGRTSFRKLTPLGIVRNPDGDYLMGHCLEENRDKRFYLKKLKRIRSISKLEEN